MAKFLIVEARFYDELNDMLIAGATDALKAAGHEHEIITVPGALEIPAAISMAIDSDLYDGFIAVEKPIISKSSPGKARAASWH